MKCIKMKTKKGKNVTRFYRSNNKILSRFHGRTNALLSGLVFGTHNSMRVYPFLIFCVFGLAGVLVDLDHFVSPALKVSRPLHLPYLIIVGCICIGYHTYVHRWFHNNSLKWINTRRNKI